MTTVSHAWLYDRFTKIQSNLSRKKLCRINQGSNFLWGSFIITDNIRAKSNLEEKVNPSILKDDFSSSKHKDTKTNTADELIERTSSMLDEIK